MENKRMMKKQMVERYRMQYTTTIKRLDVHAFRHQTAGS
jgi:hypothetical protein